MTVLRLAVKRRIIASARKKEGKHVLSSSPMTAVGLSKFYESGQSSTRL